jgi:glutamine amidotransferase
LIAIFDYGSGNLKSAQRAFETTGTEVIVTSDISKAKQAAGLVVPGVGAFAACMEQLVSAGGDQLVNEFKETGKPIFGICVGMQVLFSSSEEKGSHKGLGIFKGSIKPLKAKILPQIGWNKVSSMPESQLFKGVEDEFFYFVHSYAADKEEANSINTFSEYGSSFLAAIESENVSATQFHPEKSGKAGLALITNWVGSLN